MIQFPLILSYYPHRWGVSAQRGGGAHSLTLFDEVTKDSRWRQPRLLNDTVMKPDPEKHHRPADLNDIRAARHSSSGRAESSTDALVIFQGQRSVMRRRGVRNCSAKNTGGEDVDSILKRTDPHLRFFVTMNYIVQIHMEDYLPKHQNGLGE